MTAINWTMLYRKYKGKWVALQKNERTVVSSGATARQAWESAQKKGYKKPILTKIPNSLTSYVGFGL